MLDAESIPSTRAAAAAWLAAVVVLTSIAGCETGERSATAPAPAPTPMVPAIRLVGTEFEYLSHRGVTPRAHVTINDVIRPTFAAARPYYMRPDCAEPEDKPGVVECRMSLPETMPRAPWVGIQTSLRAPDEPGTGTGEQPDSRERAERHAIRMLVRGNGPDAGQEHTVQLPEGTAQLFLARPMPALEGRMIVTPELHLPGGAVLRTWLGVEEVAWQGLSTAVRFRVSVLPVGESTPEPIFEKIVHPYHDPQQRDWIPVEVALPDSTEPYHLVFESLPATAGDPSPSLPVWGDPTILRPPTDPPRPRYVVLVSLDTLRARSMSAYGYEVPTTPRFEKLLEEGTLFENAFTTFSNTMGSHMSMFTGLYPANHKVIRGKSLDQATPTLAQRMRDAGYETAAFTENALLRATAGFQRGFAHYYENKAVTDGAGDAEGTFRRALDWMKNKSSDEPLFVFVHTYEVHAPYLPPSSTREAFWDDSSISEIAKQKRDYEREILHLDRLLDEFATELSELGAPEDLLLVITADHGEEFFEHGYVAHAQLYDEVMKIPMFVRWPKRVPAGLRIEAPVSLVDVVPTILDLSHAEPIPGDGISLVPLMEGAEVDREVVYGQTAASQWDDHKIRFVARSATAKCMVREDDGFLGCFDLEADPGEQELLSPDSSPEISDLFDLAKAYRSGALGNLDDETPTPNEAHEDEIDPERREKLRLLGYVE